ncbi:MAG: glutamate dehydrogenase, partial [Candidatus Aminicenantes bacterium]|nr:glutamate dehydrogenase [Candidatus Aminicenantes bacterium]
LKIDVAFPSATQNEVDEGHAQAMVKNGCFCVCEGANMPSNLAAINVFQNNNVLFGPAKAANAGGVATSGLEMAQQSQRFYWSREEVDQKLHTIMKNIHMQCLDAAEKYGKKGDYLMGANIAGFIKVAKAMLAYGIV